MPAWAEAVRALGAVSDARGDRTLLVLLRMPGLLRALLYIATTSLIVGMVLLGFEGQIIGMLVVGFTVVVSFLVLEVIDDLDNPFTGVWAVSTRPFERITFGAAQPLHASTATSVGR